MVKDRKAQALFAVILTFLSACSASDDATQGILGVGRAPTYGVTWEKYRDQAVTEGPNGKYYIAEWDLIFSKLEDLRQHYERELGSQGQELAVFQKLSDGFEPTFSINDALSITYCVSNSFSNKSTVVADMATGARGWQNVMNVRMRYDASQDGSCNQNNASVDFAVMPTTQSGLWGCGASKSLWGSLGCEVGGATGVKGVLLLQYGLLGTGSFPGITAVGLIEHELGHILGFRHEHPWAPGGCSAESVSHVGYDVTGRRLTEYDQGSVMHYPITACNGTFGADMSISVLDGEGGRAVYGIPAAWYTAILR
jgi:hypothetical protein